MVAGHAVIDRLAEMFARRGAEAYVGEAVTVGEHMLQCAALARAQGAPDTLVAAALLHDIGHLCETAGEYTPQDLVDRRHDDAGAALLEPSFPEAVVACVRLHVAAKRYLCAVDDSYFACLSPASRHSLALQGGPMIAAEVDAFRAQPFHADAVRVRLWDDTGKVDGLETPGFDDFRSLLERIVRPA